MRALNPAMTPIAATRLALFTAAMSTAGAREIAGYKTTYEVVTEGKGAAVVSKGDSVTVHAKGTVAESQKKFWSTKDAGQQPFTYKAGVGGVITGWDQGCLGMKIGEVRKLEIPAHEGYGAVASQRGASRPTAACSSRSRCSRSPGRPSCKIFLSAVAV